MKLKIHNDHQPRLLALKLCQRRFDIGDKLILLVRLPLKVDTRVNQHIHDVANDIH